MSAFLVGAGSVFLVAFAIYAAFVLTAGFGGVLH